MSSRPIELRVRVARDDHMSLHHTGSRGPATTRGAFPERGEVEPLAMSGRGLPFFAAGAPGPACRAAGRRPGGMDMKRAFGSLAAAAVLLIGTLSHTERLSAQSIDVPFDSSHWTLDAPHAQVVEHLGRSALQLGGG